MQPINTQSPLISKWPHDELRYSQVWEDFGALQQILSNESIQPSHILTIGSAGENAFNFLNYENCIVDALDLGPSQIELIKLKKKLIFG